MFGLSIVSSDDGAISVGKSLSYSYYGLLVNTSTLIYDIVMLMYDEYHMLHERRLRCLKWEDGQSELKSVSVQYNGSCHALYVLMLLVQILIQFPSSGNNQYHQVRFQGMRGFCSLCHFMILTYHASIELS